MSTARRTRDHEEIRRWAESRGGHPAQVKGTGGLLRIDFGKPEDTMEEISWDQFFDAFDESEITFLYDTRKDSRFNKSVGAQDDHEEDEDEEDEEEDEDEEDLEDEDEEDLEDEDDDDEEEEEEEEEEED